MWSYRGPAALTSRGATFKVKRVRCRGVKRRQAEETLGHLLAAVVSLAATVLAVPASAQDWPTRPVRVVNTFAVGGTADVLARTVADHLSNAFGQQFFVETRAGAGGTIGVQSVVNSPPDGYNFVLTNITQLVLAPMTIAKLGYDPLRDLTNIAYIAGAPVVLSVNPTSGVKTLQEFIAYAKKGERPMTYSSSGLGSMGHLVAETFAQKADIRVEHIPYKGASQGLMDLVGGHIVFSSQTVSSTAAQLRSGALIGLAHTANERIPDYPDLPTFKELGYPDLVSTIWFSLSGPAGLPDDIVQKVNREIKRAVNRPDVQQRLRQDGMVSETMSTEEFRKFIEAETARWKPAIERAGLIQP
jgi:tripartite-type tricarboxylate transporter receptor subunit TctC